MGHLHTTVDTYSFKKNPMGRGVTRSKTDANHKLIRDYCRSVGATVIDTYPAGRSVRHVGGVSWPGVFGGGQEPGSNPGQAPGDATGKAGLPGQDADQRGARLHGCAFGKPCDLSHLDGH